MQKLVNGQDVMDLDPARLTAEQRRQMEQPLLALEEPPTPAAGPPDWHLCNTFAEKLAAMKRWNAEGEREVLRNGGWHV
jgi:hypothetical protein